MFLLVPGNGRSTSPHVALTEEVDGWGGEVAALPSTAAVAWRAGNFLRGGTVGSGPARLQRLGKEGPVSPSQQRGPAGQAQQHLLGCTEFTEQELLDSSRTCKH